VYSLSLNPCDGRSASGTVALIWLPRMLTATPGMGTRPGLTASASKNSAWPLAVTVADPRLTTERAVEDQIAPGSTGTPIHAENIELVRAGVDVAPHRAGERHCLGLWVDHHVDLHYVEVGVSRAGVARQEVIAGVEKRQGLDVCREARGTQDAASGLNFLNLEDGGEDARWTGAVGCWGMEFS
jgi:hypothetical protein